MRVLPTLLLLALTGRPLPAAEGTGRVALFNGRDLEGWTIHLEPGADLAPAAVWSGRDGVLRLDARPRGYLRTAYSSSNYRLHVAWRWPADAGPAPNSGLIVHLNGPDRIWPDGYEVQLKAGLAGEIVAFGQPLPGGVRSPRDGLERRKLRGLGSERAAGDWNVLEVVCRGDTLDIVVNGVRQNTVEHLPVTSGAIALQLEGAPVEFRDVWLEPLARHATVAP